MSAGLNKVGYADFTNVKCCQRVSTRWNTV